MLTDQSTLLLATSVGSSFAGKFGVKSGSGLLQQLI